MTAIRAVRWTHASFLAAALGLSPAWAQAPAAPAPPPATPAANASAPAASASVSSAPAAPPADGTSPPAAAAPAPAAAAGTAGGPGEAATAPAAPKTVAKPKPPAPPRETAVLSNDPRPTFAPDTRELIEAATERYAAIVAAGGWPTLPPNTTLRPGSAGAAVRLLRARLAAEGDLAGDPASPAASPAASLSEDAFDARLGAAVKRFQARHGLRQTGIVAGATLREINVSAERRLLQLTRSAERLAQSPFAFGERYVVVNIPAATVEAVAGGAVAARYVAVVGKPDRASPTVQTRITSVNFNPTWTIPTSIVRKDIIPKMRKDPSYLARSGIRVIGASGAEIEPGALDWSTDRATAYTLRQDPGAQNSLGRLRIDMPNREAVYLHDTPSKSLFARDDRFHSSGCVRVAGIRDLAAWLLDAPRTEIDAAIDSNERRDRKLPKPVPVAWTYLTGYATADGKVHFRPDIYGLDAASAPAAAPAPTAGAGSGPGLVTGSIGRVAPPRAPLPNAGAPLVLPVR